MNKNIQMIEIAVQGLKHLADQVVFTGGATVSLYIDDTGAPEPRPTYDVDCVIEVTGLSNFYEFEKSLNELGFTPPEEKDAPICRWVFNKIKVDFIPTDGNILGFSNEWHKKGVLEAIDYKTSENLSIKIFPTPIFIASKIEAFKHRGQQDYRTSHDIEDVITVLNGCSKILDEITISDSSTRNYLKSEFGKLLSQPYPSEIIYSHLPANDKGRVDYIENIINKILML